MVMARMLKREMSANLRNWKTAAYEDAVDAHVAEVQTSAVSRSIVLYETSCWAMLA